MLIAVGDVVEVNLFDHGKIKKVLGIVERNWDEFLMVLVGTEPTPFCTVANSDVRWVCPGALVGWKSTDTVELINTVASPQDASDDMLIAPDLFEDEKEFEMSSLDVKGASFKSLGLKESSSQQNSTPPSCSSIACTSACTTYDFSNPLRFLFGVFDSLTSRTNSKNLISVLSLLGMWVFLEFAIRLCTLPTRLESLVLFLMQIILLTLVVSEVALVQPAAKPSSAVCVALFTPFVILSFLESFTIRNFVVSVALTLLMVAAVRY